MNLEASEKQIQDSILEWLSTMKHCKAWRNNVIPPYNKRTGSYQRMGRWSNVGSADILGIYKGYFLAIEVKRPKGRLTDTQRDWLTEMVDHGAIAFVARSLEDAQYILSQIDEGIEFTEIEAVGGVC